MKNFMVATVIGLVTFIGATGTAIASEQECQKLKNDHDVIYASKGFCFKDAEAKAKFNEDCRTPNPKFNEKEKQKLDAIKERQKELKCD